MSKEISDIVRAAAEAIWLSYDAETALRGFELLSESADAGDADALCYYGLAMMGRKCVWPGLGLPLHYSKGVKCLVDSALAGNPAGIVACVAKRECRDELSRRVREENVCTLAVTQLEERAAGGDFMAALILAEYFYAIESRSDNENVSESNCETRKAEAYRRAATFYEMAYDAGASVGLDNYVEIASSGLDPDTDVAEYEERLARLARSGSPEACQIYGNLLETKYNDYRNAFLFYRTAYDAGNVLSAFDLGRCYDEGVGTEADFAKALELYKEAAAKGHAGAQFALGDIYFSGRDGGDTNYEEAIMWLRRCYDKTGDWRAAAELGVMSLNGLGMPVNDSVAFRYLNIVEAGDNIRRLWPAVAGPVLTALGVVYAFGRGTEVDIDKGLEYLDAAIAAGYTPALFFRKQFRQ